MELPNNPLEAAPNPQGEPVVATRNHRFGNQPRKEHQSSHPSLCQKQRPQSPIYLHQQPRHCKQSPAQQKQRNFHSNQTLQQNQRRYRWQSQHPSRNPPNPFTQTSVREAWRQSQPRQNYLRSPHQPPTPPHLSRASFSSSTTSKDLWIRPGIPYPTSVPCAGRLRRPSKQRAERAKRIKVADKPGGKGRKKVWDQSA